MLYRLDSYKADTYGGGHRAGTCRAYNLLMISDLQAQSQCEVTIWLKLLVGEGVNRVFFSSAVSRVHGSEHGTDKSDEGGTHDPPGIDDDAYGGELQDQSIAGDDTENNSK